MLMRSLLTLFVFFVATCGHAQQSLGYLNTVPYAPLVPLERGAFEVTVAEFQKALPCAWVVHGSGAWDRERYDFACHIGHWGGVTVLVDKGHAAPDKIGRVRLLWQEWQGGRYASEEDLAASTLFEVIEFFVPPVHGQRVAEMFFGDKDGRIQMLGGEIDYTFSPRVTHNLHRLEIVSWDRAAVPPDPKWIEKNNKNKAINTWINP